MKRRPERFEQFWNCASEMQGKLRTRLYRAGKISGTETNWENTQHLENKSKKEPVSTNKCKTAPVMGLWEERREGLGKLTNKLINTTTVSGKKNVDNLKAQQFREFMSTDHRRTWKIPGR